MPLFTNRVPYPLDNQAYDLTSNQHGTGRDKNGGLKINRHFKWALMALNWDTTNRFFFSIPVLWAVYFIPC